MTKPSARSYSAAAVERFLCSLAGVRSARVVAMEAGTLDEIHVLCAPALQPKQVVRNIESALCAGLGMRIDRRIVSVAQLRVEIADAPQQPRTVGAIDTAHQEQTHAQSAAESGAAQQQRAESEAGSDAAAHLQQPESVVPGSSAEESAEETRSPLSAGAAEPGDSDPNGSRRFLFVGYDASIEGGRTKCRVSIRRARRVFNGTGSGSNSAQGRATAAAEAVLNAVADAAADRSMGLDGATIIELGGRPFVLVSALGLDGRENTRLTGIAALVRSPEEAAILAGLQAANRWSETR